ncbi:hypothetical protein ACKFKG_26835 [Phormidesmis sp. 146-35]
MNPVTHYLDIIEDDITELIGTYGDRLERMTAPGRLGLLLALSSKVYACKTGVYAEAMYGLTDAAEDSLGDPSDESHEELPDVLQTLEDISSDDALRLIAFLSQ